MTAAATARGVTGRLLLIVSVTLSSAGVAASESSPDASCNAPTEQETTLVHDDFRWFYDRDEMERRYAEIYASGKRLLDRARWNDDTDGHELVHRTADTRMPVPISADFIANITNHIERGLELDYFEHVFFPDMGHAHLLIPQPYYDDVIAKIPATRLHDVYTRVLAHPGTRFLYHTAEQLRMLADDGRTVLPDKYLGWRYFTRNVVGRNDSSGMLDIHGNLESIGNTVCEVRGPYRYWGAGFHLSASKDGCFPFTHEQKTFRFDISLSDLPHEPDERGPLARNSASPSDIVGEDRADLWGAESCSP